MASSARAVMDTGIQYGVHPGITQQKDDIEKGVRDIFERYHTATTAALKSGWRRQPRGPTLRETLPDALEGDQTRVTNVRHYLRHISETEFDRGGSQGHPRSVDIDAMIDMGICGPTY